MRPNRGRPRARPAAAARGREDATRARQIAVRVLERVDRSGAYADIALHNALAQSHLPGRDRALCTELVFGTLRWRGRLDFVLQAMLDRPLGELELPVVNALRLGAYQILFTDRIPHTAAVDQAVRCTRALGAERAAGLVNAVLRRLVREHAQVAFPSLEQDPAGHLCHALSLPPWLATRWIETFGSSDAAALASASNLPPPLAIRVNRTRNQPGELLETIRERFPEARPSRWAPAGLVLGRRGEAGRDPAFLSGLFTIQDEASQLVVSLLDPQPGDRVLDTCAAPGTKTSAIAECVGETGSVVALDRNPQRLRLVARDARRLGLSTIRTVTRDATQPLGDLSSNGAGQPAVPFDRVLVDAPCSGLGTLRRNPDARWRVRPDAPASLSLLQRSILERAGAALRPGGRLVYSTCTLVPEENEQVVEHFLKQAAGFRRVPAEALPRAVAPLLDPGGDLRCLPHVHDTDGFFAACLERVQ